MIELLAIGLSAIVSAIAVLHAHWGLGGVWPAASAEHLAKTAVGTPGIRKMPSAASCFVVAGVLAGVASWPLFATGPGCVKTRYRIPKLRLTTGD